ncbi:dihydroxyacetone kinase subunit L [Herbidospora sp. NEAU-GS84]|uniref:Dihydroxyacetone kinase subunit L n=1 Tax=Herbidospora solisilvae TaxID=2696284 RepID=A0A7C9J0S1_9ACTN|nr:dihydroxyacetone kinase subunit DhaL [Herbidospora solisilvae]NAS21086.1 dihydroxyacetone kinase subunit L [Herbidospora solisilvae]
MDTAFFLRWIAAVTERVRADRDHLTDLDRAIGDADHGANLDRGFTAVEEALAAKPPETPSAVLTTTGTTLIRKVGGASGPLYGTLFRTLGRAVGEVPEVSQEALAEAFAQALAAVMKLGSAQEGDKTMIDALAPAVPELRTSFDAAARAALDGARATTPMRARKGRASYLGDRSIGHQDPGATSTALVIDALRAA